MPELASCPHCGGRGIIVTGDQWARICPCVGQENLAAKFKNARLAPEIKGYTFKGFNPDFYARDCFDDYFGENRRLSHYDLAMLAFDAAREFVAGFLENPRGEGLLLTGPVGSGKTFLAGAIANAVLEGGGEVLFLVVPDLLDEIKATYDNNNGNLTEQDLMDAARQAPLLVLDDLGAHNYTEWARNKLYSIINHRMNYQRPTIVTTNIDLDELDEYLGERTTSRLSLVCKAYRLSVDTDIRILKKKENELRERNKKILTNSSK